MLNFLKDYFSFTKSQRNGVAVLLLVIFILIMSPKLLPLFIKEEVVDFSQFKAEIEAFERQAEAKTKEEEVPYLSDLFKEVQLFEFNPNGLPEEKWKSLGINERTIKIIKNYESKGGKFYKKSDLKKIYGFKDNDYERLEPYINIPSITYSEKKHDKKKYEPNTIKKPEENFTSIHEEFEIELNSADSVSLTRLRGIGKAYSSRILNYGKLLGGFVRKEQLLEVYGVDTTLYVDIESKIVIDTGRITRININRATIEELSAHPYIDYHVAKAVYNYRIQHGMYLQVDEIKKSYVVNDELFAKIVPYLAIE